MFRQLSLFCILVIFLIGCYPPTTAKPNASFTPQMQVPTPKGQYLPISAQATVSNGTKIDLEIAATPQQQMMGLMYRPALPDNRGMLFLFPSARPLQFWMKNVPVALDMVFIRDGVIKYIETSAPPCKSEPCPTYGPKMLIDQVIELRSGRAKELGLQIGDRIKIEMLKPTPTS